MKAFDLPTRTLTAMLILLTSFLVSNNASAQDTWKFRKEKEKIIASDPANGKERAIFDGGETKSVDDGDTITTEINYAIVSYVGPYVTVLKSFYSHMQGAAHDSRERTFEVMDASTGKPVKLTDLFTETDILHALLQDKYIKDALTAGASPKSLAELTGSLKDTDMARFGDYMYGSFAFHHVEPGKVAIRMGLAYSYEVVRGAFTQVGFFLPVPEKLKTPLASAVTNKTLMKDLLPKIPQLH